MIWCYTTDPTKRWEYCNPIEHEHDEKEHKMHTATCPTTNILYKTITYKRREDEERILSELKDYKRRAAAKQEYYLTTLVFDLIIDYVMLGIVLMALIYLLLWLKNYSSEKKKKEKKHIYDTQMKTDRVSFKK